MKVEFARPDIGEEEIAAVSEAIRNGWVTSGPKMKEFENLLAGIKHAVAVNSATSGLHLALAALNLKKGDEVLVPTLTFTATAEVVAYFGAIPILCDIDPLTLNISVTEILNKLSPKTVGIMPVHFAGLSCNMNAIWDIASDHSLWVVEDAAHAFGAKYNGIAIGQSKSDATVFSFYATKCITTGEGGAIITNQAIADRCKVLRLHGINRDAFNRYNSTVPAWEYDVIAAGYKYNMGDMAASMGIVQLSRDEGMRKRRQEIATQYDAAFIEKLITPPSALEVGTEHARHLYPIQVPDRDKVIQKLFDAQIGASVHFKPLHKMTVWKTGEVFKHADSYYDHCLSLPIHSGMTSEQIDYVIDTVLDSI